MFGLRNNVLPILVTLLLEKLENCVYEYLNNNVLVVIYLFIVDENSWDTRCEIK